ncbi:hypothetical protein [Pseudomonas aeruginosa]|uniref:hypothetical protein n=1 Tax=Pseudomonas aeruginosa TaxID=287 RepID=UPI001CBE08F7|nr:hypothetical protein [Pseudomonas aeruginosa]
MSKQSHTPGPWHVSELNATGNVDPYSIFIEPNIAVIERKVAGQDQNDMADASLIAAAPDLLAELKKTVDNEQQAVFEDWLLRTRPSGCFELVQSQFHESSDFADFRESWKSQIAAIAKATA